MTRVLEAARSPALWAGVYTVFLLLTQLGAVTQEVINWDESTFMLLGQELLQGDLPYIVLFDNKPPGIFFLFAGWMGVFGESVLSVRLLGDLCLLLTALLIFAICRRFASGLAAGAAGALHLAVHAVDPGLYTSAGLPAMVFVMAALWLVLARREHVRALVLAGICMSVAVLIRSNLAYVALASGLWFLAIGLWRPGLQGSRLFWWSAPAYGLGGLLPVLAVVGLYWQAGAVAELKLASVDVALNYSQQWGVAGAALENLRKWGLAIVDYPVVLGAFTLLATWALGVFFARPGLRRQGRMGGHDWAIVWVFLLATLYSILKSGAVYTYYWQQMFPFAALFVAYLFEALARHPLWRGMAFGLVVLAAAAGIARTGAESLRVLTVPGHMTEGYDIRRAAEVLAAEMAPGDRIWALDRHLIHVYLDLPVLSPILAHPSNITRTAIAEMLSSRGYIAEDELGRVMESRPEFLVSNGHGHLFYFRDQTMIDRYMAKNYDLIFSTPLVTIHRRKDLAERGELGIEPTDRKHAAVSAEEKSPAFQSVVSSPKDRALGTTFSNCSPDCGARKSISRKLTAVRGRLAVQVRKLPISKARS